MSLIILNVDEVRRTLSASGGNFVTHDKEVDIVRFSINSGFADIVLDGQVALRVMYQRPGEAEVRAQTLTYYDTDGLHNYYDWKLTQSDLAKNGSLTVALCILRTSGNTVEEWHTTPCAVKVLGSIHTDDSDASDDTITPTVAQRVAVLESVMHSVAGGAPVVVSSVSDMTDTDKLYVLTTDNNWYYHNGTTWVSGGEYGAAATDTTLTQSGAPADAKAVGDEIVKLKADLGDLGDTVRQVIPIKEYVEFDAGYIKTGNISIGATVNLTPTVTGTYIHAVVECVEGDVFVLTDVYSSTAARAWAFLDTDNKLLKNSTTGLKTETAIAPANTAKAVFNNNNSTGSVYKLAGDDKITPLETGLTDVTDKVSKLTKYVSTTGDDSNDGNTASTPYATVGKAIGTGASTIYIKHGTYTEPAISENTAYRYKGINIIADNATLVVPNGLQFRYSNVNISGLNVVIENPTASQPFGIFLLNCTGRLIDCMVSGASYMAFRLDGSRVILERCVATGASVDGFNGHTVNAGYETECTLIDCKAYDNGDDGLSFHERGTMYVEGGEYYNNGSTGIAPHQSCKATIRNAYIHDNGHSGVEFFNPSTASGYEVVDAMSYGNLYRNNGQYGLNTQYYNVISVNDKFADNASGEYNQGTGATLTVY